MLKNILNNSNSKSPIGVLDSGIGGLSTLAVLRKTLPNEDFIFYADHKNAPYGDKTTLEVEHFVYDIITFFMSKNVKAIVIACNTAVSVAVKKLRKEFNIPILGLEPAIKVAYDSCKEKDIAIMATKLTINGEKLKLLLKTLNIQEKVVKLPASGLVELIEDKNYSTYKIKAFLTDLLKNINENDYSYLVLGCTHYIFIKKEIEEIIGRKIKLVDGNLGIAKHLKKILADKELLNSSGLGNVELITSGNEEDNKRLKTFYKKAEEISFEV
jgi:glutamate racemase